MSTEPGPEPPAYDLPAAAAGDAVALDAAVDWLLRLGAQALAEDAEHGGAWGLFADWAWRAGLVAQPADAQTVGRWLGAEGYTLPADRLAEVLDAIAAVHRLAGAPDPTTSLR